MPRKRDDGGADFPARSGTGTRAGITSWLIRDERVAEACLRLGKGITQFNNARRPRCIIDADGGGAGVFNQSAARFEGWGLMGGGHKGRRRSVPLRNRSEILRQAEEADQSRYFSFLGATVAALMLAVMLTWITHHTFFSFAVSSFIPPANVFVCTN